MKKRNIITLVIFILLIGGVFLANFFSKKANETRDLCYSYYHKTDRGFYDKVWLEMKITSDQVTGQFDNYLAEKDSKIGAFSGVVGPLDQKAMSRRADVFWDTYAEGMHVSEELLLDFGDGSAVVLFGEAYDRGDGVYIYKDKTKLIPSGPTLSQVDCVTMHERRTVESYVEKNIKIIATNNPILGGSWYVIAVSANTTNHTGEVRYEDGHIERTATFSYTFDPKTDQVLIQNFKAK